MFGRKDTVEVPDLDQRLKRALSKGDLVAFKRLVKGGVDVNSKYWYNSSLLHEAVQIGKPELVEFLLQNSASVNSKNNDNRTALHLACRGGLIDVVQVLLKYGAEVNAETLNGQTPVYLAAWRENVDLVKLLVHSGANVNIQDKDGWLPIHWAIKLNKPDLVAFLVENGSQIDTPAGKDKVPPLLSALMESKYEISQVLLTHGADCTLLDQADNSLRVTLEKKVTNMSSFILNLIRCRLIQSEYQLHNLKFGPANQNTRVLPFCNEIDQSLSGICRGIIRRHLKQCLAGRSIYRIVQGLQIPKLLKEYLLFEGDYKVKFVTTIK